MHYKETQYGFEWGSLKVERCCSDDKKGWVVMRIVSPKGDWQVYATKTGKVRIYQKDNKELTP